MTKLNIQIEELISNSVTDFQISKIFKLYYKNYLDSIHTTVEATSGKDFFIKHTKHTDKFLILLYKYILRKNFGTHLPLSNSIPITLVALGSYGREQLCIYSDIDIIILYEDVKGYNLKTIIEEFIALAWDCGLNLGSRVDELKNIVNVVKEDITIKSSILESRMIYGSKNLWFSYENVLAKLRKTDQKEFILKKLEEHKQRLLKFPLKMEPNIKDGYGGLREANMMYWMANILYGVTNTKNLIGFQFSEDEYKKYRQALEFIYQVRTALHIITKKRQDLVTLDILPTLSTKLGFKNRSRYTKDRLCMSKIISCLHTIHSFTATMIKKFTRVALFEASNIPILRTLRYKKNLYIIDNELFCSFKAKPKTLNNFIKELIELPANIDRFDRSYIYYASKTILPKTHTKELKKNIKLLLSKQNLYPLIKLIYNAGLFQTIFPNTKMFINQPQFDGYHKHPVDIHSIKALEFTQNIDDIEIKSIFDELTNEQKILVRLVTLFHDVGKGRKENHHIVGEKLFKSMLKSFGFDEEFIKTGSSLVRNHNIMSYIATNEDIYSEKTILNFMGLVKTKESLKMLYIVTYCDISSIGQNIFSNSSLLLKQLYYQTLPIFDNIELLKESKRRIAKQNTIKNLEKFKNLPKTLQKKIMNIASNQIFLKLNAVDILDIAIKTKDVDSYIYKIINETKLMLRIIRKQPLNLGFLLGKLKFLNIDSMNIYKLYDNKKAFEISFSEKVNLEDIPLIEEIIKDSFDMTRKIDLKPPIIKKEDITIDYNHTSTLVSMHIVTKDQKGLFAYIAQIFDDFGVEIESAKLYTVKGVARELLLIEKDRNFYKNQENIVNLICGL